MEKQIKTIDKERNIMRITTTDSRWYARPAVDPKTGLPIFEYVPSSTWIAGYWPRGINYYRWLAEHGWDESQAIMEAAGNRGSKVHQATEYLEETNHLPIDMAMTNTNTGVAETFNADELECIMSFVSWWKATKPILVAKELTVFGDGFAGTLDRIYIINGRVFIVDLKTSKDIWTSHIIQVSSYNHAVIPAEILAAANITAEMWANRGMAILQLGYTRNKNRYKWTEIDDRYDLFLLARQIWAEENNDAKPKERDYPLVLTLKEESNGDIGTASKKK